MVTDARINLKPFALAIPPAPPSSTAFSHPRPSPLKAAPAPTSFLSSVKLVAVKIS
ncbi:hypothetical protein K503DRAFT_777996 [Rhizopogon vinicolor AM-OR11-026]|uniref:Uncharacterized protein n=1 Tax=Rhizopogon vinicolor AM-OR11-026 TaxID=1314800 RepID=A0A1B7ME38_9AGAM|nr:hypothetical protein K503DRAFT_777996 [Rhizopogon vinicolor AM-OR11-026]